MNVFFDIFAAASQSRALNSDVVMARRIKVILFLPPYGAAGIRTRVAPNQQDLLKDALPTELPCCGIHDFVKY